MNRRTMLAGVSALAALAAAGRPAFAQDEPFKIGLILNQTGPFAAFARQAELGARLYMQEHGDVVAGRKIELIVRDDAAIADTALRVAQELIVNERVNVIAGFGITPVAMAVAPLTARAKIPMVVMNAATSAIVRQSPYVVRTSYTTAQINSKLGEWAAAEGIRSVVTIVTDYGPGHDAEAAFRSGYEAGGGTITNALKVPLQNPDFSAFLQRVADEKPEAVYVYTPGFGAQFLKQFVERGLDTAGVRILADGGTTEDEVLNSLGAPALGAITAFHYSAALDTPLNKAFVEGFQGISGGSRPSLSAIGAYDGMHLIYAALESAGASATGDDLIGAMKGMSWDSPRGPISIDAETGDIIQNVYILKVEERDGELWNIPVDQFEAVSDPS